MPHTHTHTAIASVSTIARAPLSSISPSGPLKYAHSPKINCSWICDLSTNVMRSLRAAVALPVEARGRGEGLA